MMQLLHERQLQLYWYVALYPQVRRVFFSRFIGRFTTPRARRQILASNSLATTRPKKYFIHFIYVFWQRRYRICSYCSVVREL